MRLVRSKKLWVQGRGEKHSKIYIQQQLGLIVSSELRGTFESDYFVWEDTGTFNISWHCLERNVYM